MSESVAQLQTAEPLLNMDLSSSKTLNPINAQDSTPESHLTVPNEPQITPVNDDVVVGEKRKRDDGDDVSIQDNDGTNTIACIHAHTEEELVPHPEITRDTTSEPAKKVLKIEEKRSVSEDSMVIDDAFVEGSDCYGSINEFSICVVNLPKRWCNSKLRNFLKDQAMPFKHTKKKKTMGQGVIIFENAEQILSATKKLDGKMAGGRTLKVTGVIPQSFGKKKSDKENVSVDAETNDDNSKAKNVRDIVTPLAHLPYADQLEQKKSSLIPMLKKLTRNTRKACETGVSLPEWVLKSKEIAGLPCELEGIIASPIVNGYRNKCEFSVGYSMKGKVTVGFMLGDFREGVTAVEEALDCPNVSEIACKYATIFQEFLQHSDLPVWNSSTNTGFWRQLTVREGRTNGNAVGSEAFNGIAEVMLIMQVSTSGFDDAQVAAEFKRLAQAFVAGATSHSPTLPLTTLVVQDHQGISNVAPADAPLHSLPIPKAVGHPEMDEKSAAHTRIHDYISNLQFSISPTAFFQVNTLAAEKLYSLAGDWACLGPDTLLFDICCGTGTISLTLAHRVGKVVGIEMDASAVSDARRNAEINGIKNCEFICSKAEDVIGLLLKEYENVAKEQVDDPNISGSSNVVSKDSSCKEPKIGENESLQYHCSENNNTNNNVQEGSASQEPENGERASYCSENNNTNNDVSEGSASQEPENGEGASHCSENNNTNNDVSEGSASQEPENGEGAFHCSENNNTNNDVSKDSASQEPENVEGASHCSENNNTNNDVSKDSASQEPENGEGAFHCSENNNTNIDISKDSASQEPENVEGTSHCSENNNTNNDVSKDSASQEPENVERASHCLENNTAEIRSDVQKDSSSEKGNTSSPKRFKNVVAIIDSPRAGLHPTVIKALRTHPGLQRLVYISCNPESLVANAIELCTPSPVEIKNGNPDFRGWKNISSAGVARYRSKSMPISEPFKPVKAMAVDLFPHTPHCELVMLFER
ncbi:PREDICTED: zinc finger CCCH domain-containing protein 24-like isoform X2 [Lupinus angustifolius]|uniref:zinc finger CCCH domain-containing protein 24-like isoform X2 n=1 Tax=Lupinus angustifolius TaxID=3871 RepID=UPI00092E3922|nr:PREDICTED: zinc finger CCCH domain-containing protein 24-like isoform X2 [Lupinus angustifolius]